MGHSFFRLAVLAAPLVFAAPAHAQTTQRLVNPPPNGAGIGFLLTDGRVLYQSRQATDFYTLTPSADGNYVTGTWAQVASLPSGYSPTYFASATLADGRVVITGGEYNFGVFVLTNLGAVYDPVANTWTSLPPPPGWDYIGDSPSAVLPDGRFLVGRKLDTQVAALDPSSLTWTLLSSAGKADFNAEEGWTLLPNGTVLTYDVKRAPHSEIYDPSQQQWQSAGSTIANLQSPPETRRMRYGNGQVYRPPGEVGPGILRPDGTVFATGGTHNGATAGHTAIYTPAPGGGIGTWAAGPDFPTGMDAADSFAVLLPSGNVLVESEKGALFEFDGTTLTQTVTAGGYASLIVLPTGEVLIAGNSVYREAGVPNPAWAPTISQVPTTLVRGTTYVVNGTQFNGMSQAAAFGDEDETATNYPLVRITNVASGHVFYARTHDHSSMAVATGTTPEFTNFDVPANMDTGACTLEVVANGIASTPVDVSVQ